jgi:hypothetical protein
MIYESEKGIDSDRFSQEDWKEYEKDYSEEDSAPESEEIGPDTKRDFEELDELDCDLSWIDELNRELENR